ncbi:MAG TPA: hypothetical protein VGU02_13675 [Gaiellaceae bacterium]|nr:hypothetical protein [Gaiellaceae bacterium]
MTLSTPVKVIALAGLALFLGAGGVLMVVTRHSTPAAPTPPAVVKVVQVSAPTHHAAPARPKLRLDPSVPHAVIAKLQRSREVVAFVYTGVSGADRAQLADVRAGAREAHVPFVALDVTKERMADEVFAWTSSSADPNVLVVKRPGTIAFERAGLVDRQTVAQAAASAR